MAGCDSLAAAHGPITVLLVDDKDLVRRALAVLLDSVEDIAVVGEAVDTATAVRLAVRTRPDVVLVDAAMPSSSGPDICRELLRAVPSARVALLDGGGDADRSASAGSGVTAWLPKDAPLDDLCAAVRMVAYGGAPTV